MSIHPTAIIDSSAEIDSSASIGPYALIGPRVVIGPDVEIKGHACIDKDTAIGRGSRVWPFASVGADPQDLKYQGERTRLVIGEGVTIRESATIHRGTEGGGGLTEIGDGCLIMATVHVAHDCRVGAGVILSSYAVLAGHVEVGPGAIIGGLSAVHQFGRVGAYAFVGGGSGLSKDWPPYMAGASIGAREVLLAGPNVVGLKRREVSQDIVQALKGVFTLVCRNHRPLAEVLAEAEAQYGQVAEAREFIEFYRSSQRGVYR
ncbi:MAG: acyl-ACP--UDP-N-acetylglucosamine O-acyltransferase [Candidatus Adiutrix sp.]|jgi:UDP-N-acetylglucosamine acyltransferase|nr:acyl-ACP--UDP-N-acetylglucosamine O-acyltransferase [Candidatus Adiutrix sp.]